MKKIVLVLVILMLMLAACQNKPDQVALKLVEATNAQDLASTLALFTEDAVVTIEGSPPYTGKAEIQGWLEGMFADNCRIEEEVLAVDGDVVTVHDTLAMDSLKTLGIPTVDGNTALTIKDGKVQKMNFTYSETSAAALQEAAMMGLILKQMELTNQGKIAEQLQGFKDDAVVTIEGKPYLYHQFVGKEAIGAFLEEEFAGGFRVEPTAVLTVNNNEVVAPTRFALDAFSSMGIEWMLGTDTYVLQDGQIQSHTWTISEESLATLAAMLPPPLTVETLAGTWEWTLEGKAFRQEYRPDGTYELAHLLVGKWAPFDSGQFQLDGALLTGYTLTLISDEKSQLCQAGAKGQIGVFMNETGQLAIVQGQDECWQRNLPVSEPLFGDSVIP